ncbi:MAG: hypothetical protein ACREQV_25195, partial [Candidatus Binatia bacterium]
MAGIVHGIRTWLANTVNSAMLERAGLSDRNVPTVKGIHVAVSEADYGYAVRTRLQFTRPLPPSSGAIILETSGSVLEATDVSVNQGRVSGEIARFSASRPCTVTIDPSADWTTVDLAISYKWMIDPGPERTYSDIAVVPEALRGILCPKEASQADLPVVTLDLTQAGSAIEVAGLGTQLYESSEFLQETAF